MGSAVKRSPAWLVCSSANVLHRLIRTRRFGLAGTTVFDLSAAIAQPLVGVWRLERINPRLELAAPVERDDLTAQRAMHKVPGPRLSRQLVKAREMNANALYLKLTPASLRHSATAGVFARGKLTIRASYFKFKGLLRVNNW